MSDRFAIHQKHRNKILSFAGLLVTSVAFRLAYKEYTTKKYKGQESLEGKTTIITGSNTGIGKETALEFAKRGAKVYLACRDLTRCENARKEIVKLSKNEEVHCRECNLASLNSIKEFVLGFYREEPKLHILVNNAGVMHCPKSETEDGFEMHLGVNYIGHFALTSCLLEKMKNSGPSRIINLTSETHKKGEINFDDLNSKQSYNEIAAYNQSKLANVLFTRELAKKLQGWCVTVNAVNPGVVYTELLRNMPVFKSSILRHFVHPFFKVIMRTPRQGAQTTIYCALAPELENVSGKYFNNLQEEQPAPQALDEDVAEKLWFITERWTSPK